MDKKKVLFVCVENSNRSQLSQAFATIHGGPSVEAFSAGSKPSGKINPKAIAAMKELGYDEAEAEILSEYQTQAVFYAILGGVIVIAIARIVKGPL